MGRRKEARRRCIAQEYDKTMHITRVEPVVVGIPEYADIVMVVVHTDEGVSGVGDATLEGQADAVLTVLATLAREVAGADAARIQHLWQSLYRDPFWRPGPIRLSAMSGIEQALWDIKGKVAGLPVFDLLGGACRDELRLYANSPVGSTPQELAESAVAIVERGFDAMKLAAPDATLPLDTPGSLRAAVARCEAIRAAVGDDIALGIDLHGRLSPAMAIAFAHAVTDLGIWFLEEPTPPEALPSIVDVARATSIPLAAGERLLTKWAFRDLLEMRACAMVQPDLAHCGGILEARLIAGMAESYGVGIAPHNPLGPVNTLASAHLSLAVPNFVRLEHVVTHPSWCWDLVTPGLEFVGGRLQVPSGPGLGVELNCEACAEHPPLDSRLPTFRHRDGAVADW